MSRKEYKSNDRKTVGFVEALDDRVLLAVAVPVPATPPPAPSPFSMAMVQRFEQKLERIDREFLAHSKQLKSSLVLKSDHLEAMLASISKRPQVQAQLATNTAGGIAAVSPVTQTQVVTNQLDRVVASLNSRLTQLSNAFEQQFGIVANPLEQANNQFRIPATALENHFQSARAGLTASVRNTVATIVLGSTSAASHSATTSSTTTASSSTAANTSGVTTSTQDFTNATTQAFSALNSATNSVDSALQGIFGAFQNQVQSSVTSLISGISSTPVGAFQPTVSFVSGNGVTFTGTSTGGTAGTTATTTATGSGAGQTGTFTTTITGSTPTATIQSTGTTGTISTQIG